ncbi:hypothetical protein ACF3MZ_18880 [Paenibacillaceae bacterium WGS1546]|uniref:hypothetical protein n=1 Tax=Cohnella sp. WGS1546 TaxID=3366810 RepID=UPI00372D0C52
MPRNKIGDELPELEEAEIVRLERLLEAYEPPYPSETEINRTIEAAKFQLSLQGKSPQRRRGAAARLLRHMAIEITVINRIYWLVSLLLYVAGFAALQLQLYPVPEFALVAIAPVPFLLGLIEVMRSRDELMLEMEMACSFNGASVMLAKLCIIGGYNIVLNVVVSVWFAGTVTALRLGEIMQLWLLPFTLISALALLIVMRLRGSTAVLLTLGSWAGCCLVMLAKPELLSRLLALPTAGGLLLIVLGAMVIVYQARRLMRRTSEQVGGDWLEIEY